MIASDVQIYDDEIMVNSHLAAGCGMFGNPGESSVLVRGKVVLHSGKLGGSKTGGKKTILRCDKRRKGCV